MSSAVYILGAFVSFICAALLLRGYSRGRRQLLLWSGFCFLGLGVSNALIFVDLVMLPETDLYLLRLSTTAVAMVLLLYGLIWESK
jgi:Family of unknown function (DUF5985)